jgi:hypothetical protein
MMRITVILGLILVAAKLSSSESKIFFIKNKTIKSRMQTIKAIKRRRQLITQIV